MNPRVALGAALLGASIISARPASGQTFPVRGKASVGSKSSAAERAGISGFETATVARAARAAPAEGAARSSTVDARDSEACRRGRLQ